MNTAAAYRMAPGPRAIMPAGASSSFIVVDDKVLDTPMGLRLGENPRADTGLASVIVIDDTVSLDWVIQRRCISFAHRVVRKVHAMPRRGHTWMRHLIDACAAAAQQARMWHCCSTWPKQMQNKCLCPLGEFSTMAVATAIERFPQDFSVRRRAEADG